MGTTTGGSSIQPNLRFGTSFLDSSKYRNRAADGEALMDKRTGEVVLKRKEDGSIMYFDREKIKLNDYIANLRALMKSNVDFSYPTIYNSDNNVDNELFTTFLLDTQNFKPISESGNYYSGVKFENDLLSTTSGLTEEEKDKGFTISKKSNGIFIKLDARPRDAALIEFCANIHDNYFKNYNGTVSEYLNEKNRYTSIPEYDKSNVCIELSVQVKKSNNTIDARVITGYARINEWSLILFKENGKPLNFDSSEILSVTLRVNNICLDKLKYLPNIVQNEKLAIYKQLIDDANNNEDLGQNRVAITHAYISAFVTQDNVVKFPDSRNTTMLNCLGLNSFNESMRIIGNISSSEGIHVSPEEPDEQTKLGLSVWAERVRDVYNKGETKDLPTHITNIDELEKLFGSIEYIIGDLTTNKTQTNNFWCETYKVVGERNVSANIGYNV